MALLYFFMLGFHWRIWRVGFIWWTEAFAWHRIRWTAQCRTPGAPAFFDTNKWWIFSS